MVGRLSGQIKTVAATQHARSVPNRSGFEAFQLPSGGCSVSVCCANRSPEGSLHSTNIRCALKHGGGVVRGTMRLLLMSLLGCVAILRAEAQSAADFLTGRVKMERAVFGLYSGTEEEPAMLVRLDKVYTDYQRKGFFRIGTLPVGIIEGVTFELERPVSLTNSLAELHRWLGPQASTRLELRRVSFVVSTPLSIRLETGRARIASEGRLELLDGVTFICGTNQMSAPHGTLQIKGENAGQLILEGTRSWTNSLFAGTSTVNPSNEEKIR